MGMGMGRLEESAEAELRSGSDVEKKMPAGEGGLAPSTCVRLPLAPARVIRSFISAVLAWKDCVRFCSCTCRAR
jgi:hypothetical protein